MQRKVKFWEPQEEEELVVEAAPGDLLEDSGDDTGGASLPGRGKIGTGARDDDVEDVVTGGRL